MTKVKKKRAEKRREEEKILNKETGTEGRKKWQICTQLNVLKGNRK